MQLGSAEHRECATRVCAGIVAVNRGEIPGRISSAELDRMHTQVQQEVQHTFSRQREADDRYENQW